MLQRNDPPAEESADTLGGLLGRARDQAGDWFRAEVALYRTIGAEKANAWKLPIALLATALFLSHAAMLALVATLFVGLAQLMNPALAGLVTVLILGGTAAILVKVALARLKRMP